LVLGVHPGWSGQALIPSTVDKARELKQRFPALSVGFDGGITQERIPELVAAGVDRFCVASAIFDAADPAAMARAILNAI